MVKIGFSGQDARQETYGKLEKKFNKLPPDFFSLGTDIDYYKNIYCLPEGVRHTLLGSLNDVVYKENIFDLACKEDVFRISLLRDTGVSVVKGQYKRILTGQPQLTNFNFKYVYKEPEGVSELSLIFQVEAESKPSTNIHALIGRNGVGKTTMLNDLTKIITKSQSASGCIFVGSHATKKIEDYFSSLISVSFSAFDNFNYPPDQSNSAEGVCYFHVGIKSNKAEEKSTLRDLGSIYNEFATDIEVCFSQPERKKRWINAIHILEADDNFSEMKLLDLLDEKTEYIKQSAVLRIKEMSSGHAIVLLTITKLVSKVGEKTLVLVDEPESHLHPPLLSAFIRSLSELLHDRNGVAIIATHSPVVIQEVPRTCVTIINRFGNSMAARRPSIETFGENVGTLTREIFGLEVTKSGFYKLLNDSVKAGGSFESILQEYGNQIGFEAKAILMSLISERDRVI